jgi:hypothetical protein
MSQGVQHQHGCPHLAAASEPDDLADGARYLGQGLLAIDVGGPRVQEAMPQVVGQDSGRDFLRRRAIQKTLIEASETGLVDGPYASGLVDAGFICPSCGC